MALFQNLTKTIRPSSSNAISTLRWARSPCSSRLGPNFFGGGGPNGRRSYYGSHNSSEPMNKRLIYGVIGLNVGVYLYGQYTEGQARLGYPQSFITYVENMSLSPLGFFKEHRYWTAITSTFAHGNLFHIGSNMVSFYYLSSFLVSTPSFTPLKLTAIILGSGLAGSAGWLASKLKQGDVKQRALGFSGSLMGVGASPLVILLTSLVCADAATCCFRDDCGVSVSSGDASYLGNHSCTTWSIDGRLCYL